LPAILDSLSTGNAAANLGSRHGVGAAQQFRFHDQLARHQTFLVGVFERGVAAVSVATPSLDRLANPRPSDLDGGMDRGVEARTELCELASHHG
jgi:hypothetical protein